MFVSCLRSDSTCPDSYSLEGAVSVSFLGDVHETCPHSYSPEGAVHVPCLASCSLEEIVHVSWLGSDSHEGAVLIPSWEVCM